MVLCCYLCCYLMLVTDFVSATFAENMYMLMACLIRMHPASLLRTVFIELVNLEVLAFDVMHDERVSYFSKNAASAALMLH